MSEQRFFLQPFRPPGSQQATANPRPNLKITGNIARRSNTLTVCYELLGSVGVVIPTLADTPTRKNELWKETCFEFFLGVENFPGYWEFNLSPAGHWNVYRFAAYRQGMQAETAFPSLPFSVQTQLESLQLVLDLDLDKIVQTEQALRIGISAVIKHKDDEVTYWALTHLGPQADFHQQDSLIIAL